MTCNLVPVFLLRTVTMGLGLALSRAAILTRRSNNLCFLLIQALVPRTNTRKGDLPLRQGHPHSHHPTDLVSTRPHPFVLLALNIPNTIYQWGMPHLYPPFILMRFREIILSAAA